MTTKGRIVKLESEIFYSDENYRDLQDSDLIETALEDIVENPNMVITTVKSAPDCPDFSAIADVKIEIEALIAEADSDLEMAILAEKNPIVRPLAIRDHEIYVNALKDLAKAIGVDLK